MTSLRAIVSLAVGVLLVVDAIVDVNPGQGVQILVGLLLMGAVSAEAVSGWVRRP